MDLTESQAIQSATFFTILGTDMSINDGWAKASLRLMGAKLSRQELPPGLASVATYGSDDDVIVFLIADDAEVKLQELLAYLGQFLDRHGRDLEAMRRQTGARIEAFLGWSPTSPQDSLMFEPSVVALLAAHGSGIVIDTYND